MRASAADSAVLACLLAWCLGTAGPARAVSPQSEREIQGLIAALADSPCRFERNGNWYDGKRAAAHLQRKYTYLREHDPATTPETFIAHAASRSSVSGRAYQVACPGQPPSDAATWFSARLQAQRAAP
ncbi:MAG TPA: DUF5329 domain-containing protein [Stenotrophomonas sp.]|nr:DUF5329 domain-containing protein [Stenotrophomonas sp.]